MSIIKVKYFDEIDTSGIEDYYDYETDFNGTKIQLDLNFNPNQVIDEERIKLANEFLENLGSNNDSVLKILRQDFKEEGVTREYCDIILDTFEKDEIDQLIEQTNKNYSKAKRLSLVLYPRRIGFYIDSDD